MSKTNPLSYDEEVFLKKHYWDFPQATLAEKLNRTPNQIAYYANKLKLRKYQSWTDAEKQYLKENYQKLGLQKCAAFLGKSHGQISGQASLVKANIPKSIPKVNHKICPRCKQEKELNEFQFYSSKKISGYCKICLPIQGREQREKNRASRKALARKRYLLKTQYIKTQVAEYQKKRKLIDPTFKLGFVIRGRIRSAILGGIKSKKSLDLLGCDLNTARRHLESKFTPNMNWDNYGQKGWHIDHIKPCASFDLTIPEEQQKCFHYTNLQPLWSTTKVAEVNGDFGHVGNLEKSDNY